MVDHEARTVCSAREERRVRAVFDDLLGDASTRYFGDGYRRTRYDVTPVCKTDRPAKLGVKARARVLYPSDWSVKGGSGRVPHLSTLDALVLSNRVIERTLAHDLKLSAADLAWAWLRSLSIRTGAAPVHDLDDVPIDCHVVASERSDAWRSTTLALKVGTFSVEALVDHPEPRGGAEAGVRPESAGPYWQGFRETRHQGSVTALDPTRAAIECLTTAMTPTARREGMEGAYVPQPTLIDALVFAGQMLQILVCATDGTSREESGNLWLRRIRFDSASPYRPARSRPLIEVTGRSTLNRGETKLHSLRARSTAMFGTTMSAQIAYADRPES